MRTARSLPYRGDLCQGRLCPGGSLSRGLSVQGALCPGGSLSRGAFCSVETLSLEVSEQWDSETRRTLSRGFFLQEWISEPETESTPMWSQSRGSLSNITLCRRGLCLRVSNPGGLGSRGLSVPESLSGAPTLQGSFCQDIPICMNIWLETFGPTLRNEHGITDRDPPVDRKRVWKFYLCRILRLPEVIKCEIITFRTSWCLCFFAPVDSPVLQGSSGTPGDTIVSSRLYLPTFFNIVVSVKYGHMVSTEMPQSSSARATEAWFLKEIILVLLNMRYKHSFRITKLRMVSFSRFKCSITKLDQWDINFFYSVYKANLKFTFRHLNRK